MGSKILLPQLVSLLSNSTGKPKKQIEVFLKAVFSTLTESLEEHDTIKIKGLGTFRVNRIEARKSVNVSTGEEVRIPAHYRVVFTPTKTMAERVNQEFAWLEVVEIADNVTNEELEALEFPGTPNDNEVHIEEVRVVEVIKPDPDLEDQKFSAVHTQEEEEESEHLGEELEKEFGEIEPVEPFGPVDPDDPEPGSPESKLPIPQKSLFITKDEFDNLLTKTDLNDINEDINEVKSGINKSNAKNKKRSVAFFIWTLLISAALITGGFFLIYYLLSNKFAREQKEMMASIKEYETSEHNASAQTDNLKTIESEGVGNANARVDEAASRKDVGNEAPTAPSDIIATDIISKTRFLTTMAKEYYGNHNLWPYIYMANQNILGHPDRITPGTSVVIPTIEKYGVDPKNPQDIEKAKKLGLEIYKRFNR